MTYSDFEAIVIAAKQAGASTLRAEWRDDIGDGRSSLVLAVDDWSTAGQLCDMLRDKISVLVSTTTESNLRQSEMRFN